MDKTLAAIYAVTNTGKSSDYRSLAYKPQAEPVKKQPNPAKTLFYKLKTIVDKLRR